MKIIYIVQVDNREQEDKVIKITMFIAHFSSLWTCEFQKALIFSTDTEVVAIEISDSNEREILLVRVLFLIWGFRGNRILVLTKY